MEEEEKEKKEKKKKELEKKEEVKEGEEKEEKEEEKKKKKEKEKSIVQTSPQSGIGSFGEIHPVEKSTRWNGKPLGEGGRTGSRGSRGYSRGRGQKAEPFIGGGKVEKSKQAWFGNREKVLH
ncbi:hypothetical protein EYF80_049252 [Liparis tanakae]|uniref:Uncharacterized protein n=1 Tax=Liparis tanakae TaxID=230148 RepID=A0A4Z2FI12_9TELE|nr:hypothetical protein EYF80_049252 [Liparis tanakae]